MNSLVTKSSTQLYPKKGRANEGSPFLKSGLCKWALLGVGLGEERGYRFGIGHECHEWHFCQIILGWGEILALHPKIWNVIKKIRYFMVRLTVDWYHGVKAIWTMPTPMDHFPKRDLGNLSFCQKEGHIMAQKGLKMHEKKQKLEFLDLKYLPFNGIFLSNWGVPPSPP